MACKKCSVAKFSFAGRSEHYNSYRLKTLECCYCGGAGHVVVGGSLFVAGQATDCRHCKGTGWCELTDLKYWSS